MDEIAKLDKRIKDIYDYIFSGCKCNSRTYPACNLYPSMYPVDFYGPFPVLKYIPVDISKVQSFRAYYHNPNTCSSFGGFEDPEIREKSCELTAIRFFMPRKDDTEYENWWACFLQQIGQYSKKVFSYDTRKYFICPSPENPFSVFEQVVPNTEKVVLKGTFLVNTDSKENIFIWFTDSEKNCFVRRALRVEKEGSNTAVYVDKAFDKPIESAGTCFIAQLEGAFRNHVYRVKEEDNSYLILEVEIYPGMSMYPVLS